MLAKTHILLSITITSFALETVDWQPLVVAGVTSQLLDVDTSSSLAGRLLLPLARWLENRWPHRTVTHSFLATTMMALLALPLLWHSKQLWYALILGYFGGWFGDVFTKSGVAAFYPLSSARLVIPAHPRLRLSTGSRAEYVVLWLLLLTFLFSLHLNTKGGLLRGFNAWLAQPEGVATLFARESSRSQILAQIEGRFVASATPVNAEFEVLEVEGEKLLVRDANGLLYWAEQESACTDCHVAIHRVQARLGQAIVRETKELRWQEEELGKVVGEVSARNAELKTRNAPTLLFSGELTILDAEGLRLPTSLQQFNPLEIVGNPDEWTRVRTVRVRAATLRDLEPLRHSFGSGNLIVKIIRGATP